MKFKNLAWGSFVFAEMASSDYPSPYQDIATDTTFLRRLQVNSSLQDFQRLRDFLTHYGVPLGIAPLPHQPGS